VISHTWCVQYAGVNGFVVKGFLLSPARGRCWLPVGRPSPDVRAASTVSCVRSSRRIPSRVAPRPGGGSVAASSDGGFMMLEIRR
jgi:hypothetical protein